MLESYSDREKEAIFEAFPNLRPATVEIDQLVVEFLKQHDVHLAPVNTKNVSSNRLTNAAMGAISPEAVYMNADITQQQKIAAAQEWTSWKQWALSHRNWSNFKSLSQIECEAHNVRIIQLLRNQQYLTTIDKFIQQQKKNKAQELKRKIFTLSGILTLCALWLWTVVMFDKTDEPSRKGKTTSFSLTQPEEAKGLVRNTRPGELPRKCKLYIGEIMGRDPKIMITDTSSPNLASIFYYKPTSDGVRRIWKYDCKVENKKIIWRGVDLFSPGEGPGRWRTEDAKPIELVN